MDTSERRLEILKVLCRRRHETTKNLAAEFNVSLGTIRKDIDVLSMHVPIYTSCGRSVGGIYIMDGYYMEHMFFSGEEKEALKRILHIVENYGKAEEEDINMLKKLVK